MRRRLVSEGQLVVTSPQIGRLTICPPASGLRTPARYFQATLRAPCGSALTSYPHSRHRKTDRDRRLLRCTKPHLLRRWLVFRGSTASPLGIKLRRRAGRESVIPLPDFSRRPAPEISLSKTRNHHLSGAMAPGLIGCSDTSVAPTRSVSNFFIGPPAWRLPTQGRQRKRGLG